MKSSALVPSVFILGVAALLAVVPDRAYAQDEYDDLDAGSDSGKKEKSKRSDAVPTGEVREIVKGTYAKAGVGGAFFLGKYAGYVSPGTQSSLGFGKDFVDREKLSMAGELSFFQGIHNGCYYDSQSDPALCGASRPLDPNDYFQGDLRTYTLAVTLEASTYPTRRIGVGGRLGGGVVFTPLLMDPQYYQQDVVIGSWGGVGGNIHNSPHPLVTAGPTIEYYTKLSHFSIEVDADIFYALGVDVGGSVAGAMKYTF